MKLAGKIVFYIVVSIVILLFCAELALRFLLPLNTVKDKITEIASTQTKSDVQISTVSAGIMGITLNGVSLTSTGQRLLDINEVYVRFNPFELLRGRVRIDTIILEGMNVKLARNKDGSFNFDALLEAFQPDPSAPKKEAAASAPFDLFVRVIQIKDSTVFFEDKGLDLQVTLNDMFLEVFQFTFDKTFSVSTKMVLSADQGGKHLADLPFGFTVYPNLENMDLKKAYANLKLFVAQMKKASFVIKGNAENFEHPYLTIQASAEDVSSAMISNIITLPEFNIPLVIVDAKVSADISKSKINIEAFNVHTLSSSITAAGAVYYGGALSYDFNVTADLQLDKLSSAIPMVQEFKPKGAVNAVMHITDKVISGNVALSDIGAYLQQAGTLSRINGKVIISDINDVNIPSIKGRLNGYAFDMSAKYKMFKDFADIIFNFKADTVQLKFSKEFMAMINSISESSGSAVVAEDVQPSAPMAWPLPPLNIKANMAVKSFDAPLFEAEYISFKVDVKHVTPALDKVAGTMALSTADGEIKDLYRLTNANAVTKVLFLSLGIVSKVVNSLNVLDVLSAIQGAVSNTITGGPEVAATEQPEFEEGEEAEEPQEPRKIEGKLDYDTFVTNLTFMDGKTDIDKCYFVSGMLSFKVKGDMNFINRKLHMTVNAAPGKHNDDGVMPLTLAIGGTIEAPTGSMSVLSSVASLVTQSLLNNPASSLLKKGLGGIFGVVGLGGGATPADTAAAQQGEAPAAAPAVIPAEGQEDAFIPLGTADEPAAEPVGAVMQPEQPAANAPHEQSVVLPADAPAMAEDNAAVVEEPFEP